MSDESKLPKWAQQELERLRRDVKKLENENKVLRSQWPKSNTTLLSLSRGAAAYDELWLPEGALLRFYLKGSKDYGDSFCVDAHVDRQEGVRLELMGHSSITVYPQSSNVIYIEAAR